MVLENAMRTEDKYVLERSIDRLTRLKYIASDRSMVKTTWIMVPLNWKGTPEFWAKGFEEFDNWTNENPPLQTIFMFQLIEIIISDGFSYS